MMTDDEYTQLVKASEAFASLSDDLQSHILKAQGKDREQYVQVFMTERNGIAAAQAEMAAKNAEVVKNFEAAAKSAKRDFFKSSEAHERKAEAKKAEHLLDSI